MAYSLRLEDYSDRELLAVVAEHTMDGWADSANFCTGLVDRPSGLTDKLFLKHARQCVGVRFGWMARPPHKYGPALLEKHATKAGLWRLTDEGEQLLKGRLSAAQQRILDGVKDEQRMHFFDGAVRQYQTVPPHIAIVMRRAWRHGSFGRKFR